MMEVEEIRRLFGIAIEREIESNEFYAKAAKASTDASVKAIFADLAKDELGHMELLERFREDPTLPMKMIKPAVDYKVAEEVALPRLSTDMKPADAIALAMKKEQQAMEAYRAMAAQCTDDSLKVIFNNLADMELGHKSRLETLFVDIGYPEAF